MNERKRERERGKKGKEDGKGGEGERRNSHGVSEDALTQVLGEGSLCLSWEAHPDCSTPTCPGGSSASSHSASVSASESGPHTSEKSEESTTPSWLWCGPSRYSVPGSGAGKKVPRRGQGLGASPGPMWDLQGWEDWGTQCP